MYRETPDSDNDSGWRFFSGDETQAYADDPSNFSLYDVNTIANYDEAIIPLLWAPVGSAYSRKELGKWSQEDLPPSPRDH
jgi:hypothetical protein